MRTLSIGHPRCRARHLPLAGRLRGRDGCAWRETDAESDDRVTVIRDLLDVQ